MALVAGCYERFLFGYNYTHEQKGQNQLVRRFTHAAHQGVVKCLASAGQYVASGGADDQIHLYDLKSDKDLGFLMNPGEGAITALEFFVPKGGFNPTHMLSGSADGTISVWSVGGAWECMKTMRGHRKEVNSISVHSSGALALSCSRDGTLRMWDLVKGRSNFTTKLDSEAEAVRFSPTGSTYALLCGTRVTLHGVGSRQGLIGEFPHPRRALCMAFSPDGSFLATGAEDGSFRIWQTASSQEVLSVPRAHATRIRGLVLPPALPPSSPPSPLPPLVATASSDGVIKLWDLSNVAFRNAAATSAQPQEAGAGARCIGEAATSARLTTLCALDAPEVMARRLREWREKAGARQAQRPQQRSGQQADRGGGGSGKKRKAEGGAQGTGAAKEQRGKPPTHARDATAREQGTVSKGGISGAQKGRAAGRVDGEAAPRPMPSKKPEVTAGKAGATPAGNGAQQQGGSSAAQVSGLTGKVGSARTSEPGGRVRGGAQERAAGGEGGRGAPGKEGVVDFMDAKDWQRAKQKKKKQRQRQEQQRQQEGGPGSSRGKGKGQGGSKFKSNKG